MTYPLSHTRHERLCWAQRGDCRQRWGEGSERAELGLGRPLGSACGVRCAALGQPKGHNSRVSAVVEVEVVVGGGRGWLAQGTGSAVLRAKGTKGCERMAATTSAATHGPRYTRARRCSNPYLPTNSAQHALSAQQSHGTQAAVDGRRSAAVVAVRADGTMDSLPTAITTCFYGIDAEAVAATKCFICQGSFQKLRPFPSGPGGASGSTPCRRHACCCNQLDPPGRPAPTTTNTTTTTTTTTTHPHMTTV
jgi:hypothetical protein